MKLLILAVVTVLATTASGRVSAQPSGDLFLTSAIILDRASGDITLPSIRDGMPGPRSGTS